MKATRLTRSNSIVQVKTYWNDMFSFPCSNSVLKSQDLGNYGIEYAPCEINTAIDRQLRT